MVYASYRDRWWEYSHSHVILVALGLVAPLTPLLRRRLLRRLCERLLAAILKHKYVVLRVRRLKSKEQRSGTLCSLPTSSRVGEVVWMGMDVRSQGLLVEVVSVVLLGDTTPRGQLPLFSLLLLLLGLGLCLAVRYMSFDSL